MSKLMKQNIGNETGIREVIRKQQGRQLNNEISQRKKKRRKNKKGPPRHNDLPIVTQRHYPKRWKKEKR